MSAWRLLDMGASGAAYNMAVDAVLLRQQGQESRPTLRVYRWSDIAITVGYSVAADRALNMSGCDAAGMAVMRRLTGGGVVVHDGALTFSLVAPLPCYDLPSSAEGLHRLAMEGVRRALARAGVAANHSDGTAMADGESPNWCMTRAYCHDLVTPAGKVAGGADRRTRDGVLYQGYLRLRAPARDTLEAAYPSDAHQAFATQPPAEDIAASPVREDDTVVGLVAALSDLLGPMRASDLTLQEHDAGRETADAVFAAPGWLSGSPRERRRLRLHAERPDNTELR
ncbi:hypothetical protein HN371_16490 [Candidatus Poribacteria bacterium]|nr:hypothetical protein [Candidatus Poribacteria bacterium]MBT5712290.1 hypothetical protein [Candidatus Poribacteria bacterium]MBT7099009.1 hypothetical protein [Candidatus Poribacteria bacterium]MBT7809255.1 hypothetical protein [Candidatus Poribacteria bacterium]